MTRPITLYYDLLSPFAHIAIRRLDELPGDVIVTPKPVLLGAVLSHWGQRGPAEIEPKRLHTYRQATHLAAKHGIALRFPPRHPFNPLAALRLLAGAQADIVRVGQAFDFVFEQGRAIDTPEELSAFAQTLGVPVETASADAAKTLLRQNTDDAIAAGVFGVPTFVTGSGDSQELFWGADSFDMLRDFLADETLFKREPYAALANVTVGIARK